MQQQQQIPINRNQPSHPQQQQQQQPQKQNNQQSQQSKLTWPAPPIYVMKQMDTLLFQHAQSIDEIKNRLNCIETGSSEGAITPNIENINQDFINAVVDNIMTNSNLSEIIEQIDVVQNDNNELRELLHAQQKTINEMNVMLLKLLSQEPTPDHESSDYADVNADGNAAVESGVNADVESEAHEEAGVELEITDK
jgi:ethanolamine utilization cobalamin adenosyltransferase